MRVVLAVISILMLWTSANAQSNMYMGAGMNFANQQCSPEQQVVEYLERFSDDFKNNRKLLNDLKLISKALKNNKLKKYLNEDMYELSASHMSYSRDISLYETCEESYNYCSADNEDEDEENEDEEVPTLGGGSDSDGGGNLTIPSSLCADPRGDYIVPAAYEDGSCANLAKKYLKKGGVVSGDVCRVWKESRGGNSITVYDPLSDSSRDRYDNCTKELDNFRNIMDEIAELKEDYQGDIYIDPLNMKSSIREAERALKNEMSETADASSEGEVCLTCIGQKKTILDSLESVGSMAVGAYSGFRTNREICERNARLGFPCDEVSGAWSGYPFFAAGLYGGMNSSQGGFGCGNTFGGGNQMMMGGAGAMMNPMMSGMMNPYAMGVGGGMNPLMMGMGGMNPMGGMNMGLNMGFGMNPMSGMMMNPMMAGMNPYAMASMNPAMMGMMNPSMMGAMNPMMMGMMNPSMMMGANAMFNPMMTGGMNGMNGMMNPYGSAMMGLPGANLSMGMSPFGYNPMMGGTMGGQCFQAAGCPFGSGGMNPYGMGQFGTGPFGGSMNGMMNPSYGQYQMQMLQEQQSRMQMMMQQQQRQMEMKMQGQQQLALLSQQMQEIQMQAQQLQMEISMGGPSTGMGMGLQGSLNGSLTAGYNNTPYNTSYIGSYSGSYGSQPGSGRATLIR